MRMEEGDVCTTNDGAAGSSVLVQLTHEVKGISLTYLQLSVASLQMPYQVYKRFPVEG